MTYMTDKSYMTDAAADRLTSCVVAGETSFTPCWSRHIVTTLVNIGDFECLTRNKRGYSRHGSRNKSAGLTDLLTAGVVAASAGRGDETYRS